MIVRKGVTLLEVLVAVFVLTVGVAGLIASFNASTKRIRSSGHIFVATRLAQAKIEELKEISYTDAKLNAGTYHDTGLIGNEVANRTCVITQIDSPAIDCMKEIDVTVIWNEGERTLRRSIVTRRTYN